MTEQDYTTFVETMTGVAETLGDTLSDFRLEGYWRVLYAFDIHDLVMAADKVLRECEEHRLPTPAEWRALILAAQDQRTLPQALAANAISDSTSEYAPECPLCDDSGFQTVVEYHRLGKGEGTPYDAVRPCPCRPTNRTYQAKRNATRAGRPRPGRERKRKTIDPQTIEQLDWSAE